MSVDEDTEYEALSQDQESDCDDDGQDVKGNEESIDSVGSDGLVYERSKRRRGPASTRAVPLDGEGDEFWDQDAWMNDDDEEWATDDEEKYKDIIDEDFDISESDSLDDLVAKGAKDDARLLRESRGYRHKRKQDLESQKKLLQVLVDSLNVKVPAVAKEEPIQSKLLVASDFNMPAEYCNTCYKGMKWRDVLESAKDAQKREGPLTSPKKASAKRKGKPTLRQADFLNAYEEQIKATREEQEARQRTAFWKEYTKGKEKVTGLAEHTALRNGPSEMFISWDGTRTIEHEESTRREKGLPSMKELIGGKRFERQMCFFMDIPSETRGVFQSHIPPVLSQKKPTLPEIEMCAVTGLPAKYKDPKTGLPYRDVEAYKIIKEQYHSPSHGGKLNIS